MVKIYGIGIDKIFLFTALGLFGAFCFFNGINIILGGSVEKLLKAIRIYCDKQY